MYAVIQSGGKQYRVAQGDRLCLERLEAAADDEIELGEVLLVADGDDVRIGTPRVDARVRARVVGHGRDDKIEVVKFRRRKHHHKRGGHRQRYTEIEITAIDA